MTTTDATALIQPAFNTNGTAEYWADLGCGDGVFTLALANCLAPGSKIDAVDRRVVTIGPVSNILIRTFTADIETVSFGTGQLDGILMANSFHFVKEKGPMILALRSFPQNNGRVLMVEYDRVSPNKWVPFPISYPEVELLFKRHGYGSVKKIGEKRSVFGPHKMYACIISV